MACHVPVRGPDLQRIARPGAPRSGGGGAAPPQQDGWVTGQQQEEEAIEAQHTNRKSHKLVLCGLSLYNCFVSELGFGGDLRVDEDAAAVFAYDDFFAQADVHLALRRDLVEAAAAGIALDGYHGQAVGGIAADTAISGDETVFDFSCSLFGIIGQFFLVFFGFGHDVGEIVLFVLEVFVTLGQCLSGFFDEGLFGLDSRFIFLDTLFGELYIEGLVFDLLVDGIEFAVITHIALLGFVFFYERQGILNGVFLVVDGILEAGHLFVKVVNAGLEPGQLIFQVLHLEGKLTAHNADLVDFGVDELQLVQGAQLFFNRYFGFGFGREVNAHGNQR